MTQAEMANLLKDIFAECDAARAAGQAEYAHDPNNAFRNFEAVGKRLHLPREKALWILFEKHADGIVAYLNGHRSQREPVQGRIKDAIVFLCLLRGMIDENERSDSETRQG